MSSAVSPIGCAQALLSSQPYIWVQQTEKKEGLEYVLIPGPSPQTHLEPPLHVFPPRNPQTYISSNF